MYFMIQGVDKAGSAGKRAELRDAHVSYWLSLGEKVKLGGPLLVSAEHAATPRASVLIIEVNSEGEAQRIAAADPFALEHVFGEVTVSPMRLTLGDLLRN